MPKQPALNEINTPHIAVTTSKVFFDEFISLLKWWYAEMPVWYIGFFQRVMVICDDTLSLSLLVKTFFVPWHRDRSWIGILFGITIRLLYLPIGFALTVAVALALIIIAFAWALLPPFAIFSIVRTPFLG